MAHPVCSNLNERVLKAAEQSNVLVHAGGTYVAIEGPQFSSQAESNLYRSWGCDVIGMTNMPEAKLAREASLASFASGILVIPITSQPHERYRLDSACEEN